MGIYLPNMEMPKSCYSCLLKRRNGMDIVCPVTQEMFSVADVNILFYRLDSCPLIEVTEPHGRLTDEREINSRFDNGIKTISELPFPNDFVELYKQLATEVKEEIGKCHMIIPASKEE